MHGRASVHAPRLGALEAAEVREAGRVAENERRADGVVADVIELHVVVETLSQLHESRRDRGITCIRRQCRVHVGAPLGDDGLAFVRARGEPLFQRVLE